MVIIKVMTKRPVDNQSLRLFLFFIIIAKFKAFNYGAALQ